MPHGKKKPAGPRKESINDKLKRAEAELRARGLDPNNLPVRPGATPDPRTLEARDPETAGKVLAETITDPIASARQIAEQYGVSELMVKGMMSRLRTTHLALREELYAVTQKNLNDVVDDRLMRALKYLDDYQLGQASARDLAYIVDRMFNMRQLIRGEPTQIMGHDERRSLAALVPLMVAEARRRGITIEAQTTPPAVEPETVEGEFTE